ncbi:hypothetical protein C5748_18470 [Phyllobacterium phragmitis]|uniref:Uncharacterized protein n=1 Tax=Phyllobacterium phragmitis TaxID=2670329 RepID=A0A2S9INN0_9HYPH|nr:hypothetical protein [Phyllobacterium phragmitis]PRD42133.1 hypothetical protein C5748_18470 [Phyllobacterium phragmitis]
MMRIAGFEFADGARFQPGAERNAKLVGGHLEMLRKKFKGELTPEDVLADAKHDNSPLHSFFEWSDTEAANQFRLQQARGLIRAVVAIYVSDDKPAVRQKAYVHIAEPSAPHYREASHAMSQKKTRQLVLQRAWRELQQWKQRYKDMKEFSDLFEVIDEVEKHLPASSKSAH